MIITDEINNKLLKEIENKCNEYKSKQIELKRLKEQLTQNKVSYNYKEEIIEERKEDNEYEVDEEDDELDFYIENYKTLNDNFTKHDLKSVIPSKNNYNFKDIIYRLIAESFKEIKEINELIIEDENISKDELKEYKLLIIKEQEKINLLKEELIEKEEDLTEEESIKNNIVLVPNLSGNIKVIDELEHIPNEYYDSFNELFNSILDNSFKNVKTFKGNKELLGVAEVKGFKTRIVFSRLNSNTYAIITAFIKKTDNDKYYQDTLKNKIAQYKEIEFSLRNKLNDPSFIEENEQEVNRLFELIDTSNKKKVI